MPGFRRICTCLTEFSLAVGQMVLTWVKSRVTVVVVLAGTYEGVTDVDVPWHHTLPEPDVNSMLTLVPAERVWRSTDIVWLNLVERLTLAGRTAPNQSVPATLS